MRIGIELNGVLRDTLKKIQQEYEKWYLNNPFRDENEEDDFKYEVISDLTLENNNLKNVINSQNNFYISSRPVSNLFSNNINNLSSNKIKTLTTNNNFYTSSTPVTIADIKSNIIIENQDKLNDVNELLDTLPIDPIIKNQWDDLFE